MWGFLCLWRSSVKSKKITVKMSQWCHQGYCTLSWETTNSYKKACVTNWGCLKEMDIYPTERVLAKILLSCIIGLVGCSILGVWPIQVQKVPLLSAITTLNLMFTWPIIWDWLFLLYKWYNEHILSWKKRFYWYFHQPL